MKLCKKCSAILEDDARFCIECGEWVEVPSHKTDETYEVHAAEPTEAVQQQKDAHPIETAQIAADAADTQKTVPVQPEPNSQVSHHTAPKRPAPPPKNPGAVREFLQNVTGSILEILPKAIKITMLSAGALVILFLCAFAAKTWVARDAMQLFLGGNKYMQMVEGSTAAVLTDQSVKVLDSTLKTLSLSGNSQAADFDETVHIVLDNSLSSKAKQKSGGNDADLKKWVNFINSISIKGSINQNNQQVQTSMAISHNANNLLSLNIFLDKDGKEICQIPELSKIYYMTDDTGTAKSTRKVAAEFKYDPIQLKASLHALTQVYVDAIPSGKVVVEKDKSLSMDGVAIVNAEKISVTFSAEQMKQMMQKVVETAKNDPYLYTFVSDNYNLIQSDETVKMDKTQYDKLLDSYSNMLSSAKLSQALTVSAYIMPDNTQVARSYEIAGANSGAPATANLNLIFTNKNKFDQRAVNFMINGKEVLSATILNHSANSGVVQVSVTNPVQNSSMGMKVEFFDLKKVKFMNKDATLGIFKVSLSGFQSIITPSITEKMGSMGEVLDPLMKSTLTLVNTMENDKFKSNISVNLEGIAAINVNSVTTPKKSSAITIPPVNDREAIVIGSVKNSEAQTKLQKQYASDAQSYWARLQSKDKDLADLLRKQMKSDLLKNDG